MAVNPLIGSESRLHVAAKLSAASEAPSQLQQIVREGQWHLIDFCDDTKKDGKDGKEGKEGAEGTGKEASDWQPMHQPVPHMASGHSLAEAAALFDTRLGTNLIVV